MKQFKTIILFILSLLFFNSSYSQHLIKGKVIDSQTKEALAFVNIIFNSDAYSGTITDIDGKFFYSSSMEIKSLAFSYIGYEQKTISLDLNDYEDPLLIELKVTTLFLQEIVVKAGENPANRIMRKVIENRKINNPENISSFKYISYNKVIYDFEPSDNIDSGSILIQKDEMLKGGHFLIMESVAERKFVKPDNTEETILGVKVSGFKHPSFAPLATDIQPFSFYQEVIPIFDINYLNPISNGSLNKYQFRIEDTLFQNLDTTFIISFKPLPGKNYEALSGLLYINTNKYAIQYVIAEPFEKGFIDIKIQQKYQFVNNEQWFPEQLNFELIISKYPSDEVGIVANGKSYIDSIELFTDINTKEFSLETVKMHDLANERDSLFWNKYRTEPLNKKEKVTYHVIDSLGEQLNFDNKLRFMEKLSQGKIPVKFIDIDVYKALVFNRFEGYRLGFGAYTNEKLLDFLSIGGFVGYGLRDHQWKYGGEFIFTINKEKELKIGGRYQRTLLETGGHGLDIFNENNFSTRSYIASQVDRIKQSSISVSFRALKYAKLNFSMNHTSVAPQYNYEYHSDDQGYFSDYTFSDLSINLKFAFKEKIIKSLNQRISQGTKYPIIYLHYSKGIKGIYDSDFEFNKIELRIEDSFYLKNLGKTSIRVDGGYVDKSLPLGLLFTGEGSFDKKLPLLIEGYFQTITPYEFLSDQYINVHFSHNFGSLLFRFNKFKPQISVHQNIGWGKLSDPENHQLIEFKTKEKGLYESGLQIGNIVKLNYLNIAYLGFGVGAFYRYGPYATNNTSDNLAIKLSVSFTTK